MKKYFKVHLFFIILHQIHKSRCGGEFSRKNEDDFIKGCEKSEYKCSTDSTCIDKTYICDGKADCQIDAEDERNCKHTCSSGYFQCAVDVCINASLVCNGIPDCPSNTDEVGCIKLEKLKRKNQSDVTCAKTNAECKCTIMNVPTADRDVENVYGLLCNNTQGAKLVSFPIKLDDNVKYFDFSQNQLGLLGSLSNSTFFSHEWSTYIYLTNNNIVKLTARMFEALKHLYHLELNENEIETLEDETFSGLENLNVLNLGDNRISKITSRTFIGLKLLENLILEGNQINHIANDFFFPFFRLKYLNLNFNNISKLESKTLANLTFLEELHLQGNKIEDIEDNSFAGLGILKILNLDKNSMIKLTSKVFNGLHSLKELLMWNNKILYIENDTFSGLHNLETLILHGNTISQLTSEMYYNLKALKTSFLFHDEMKLVNCSIFTELKNLKSLDLGSNNISKLPSVVFKNLVQLNYLYLGWNEIVIIENETFIELQNLTQLSLISNKISMIASGTFRKNKYLHTLDLEGNQIDVIEDGSFVGLENLERLVLRFNKISIIGFGTFKENKCLQYLDLEGNQINVIEAGSFDGLEHLKSLWLENNRISKLESKLFKTTNHLQILSLHHNQIQVIESDAFDGMDELENLYLNENKISNLPSRIFKKLKNLTSLRLQNNEIKSIEKYTFSELNNLLYLNLSNNSIIWKDENGFESFKNLISLETDEYRFCCLLKNLTYCSPQTNEFSSCDKLIEKTSLKICIWILGITTILSNLFVIIFRTGYKSYNINKVNSFLIKNLAISDTFMGSYLLIIAVADLSYGNEFSSYDFKWRSNTWCHIAGSMSTFSSSLTVLTLTTMTLDRFFSISFPFRTRLREIRQFRIVMTLLWIVAIIIAHLPILLSHQDNYFKNLCSRSAFCLPLHVSNNKTREWHYSIVLFIVLHTIALAIIVFSYIGIYWSTRNTRLAVHTANQSSVPHMVMIFRMTLLVLGAALSKIPIIILGVRSMYGYTIAPDIYAWIIGVVLPLNAALNPILYTISSLPITFTLFEYLEKRSFRSPIIFRSPLYLKKSTDEKLNSKKKPAVLSDNTENTNYKSTEVE